MLFKKVTLVAFIFCVAAATISRAQYRQLKFSQPAVIAGQTFNITYDPTGTPLAGMKDIKGIAYYFADFKWHGIDLKLARTSNNVWIATIDTRRDWAMLAFKFFAGDSVDINSKRTDGFLTPYATVLRNPQDTLQSNAGGLAVWGLFRDPEYGFAIPDYLEPGNSVSDTIVAMYLQRELEKNHLQAYKSTFAVPYATSLFRTLGAASMPQVNATVNYLNRADAPETDKLRAWQILKNINQLQRADSLGGLIEKKYPGSFIAKLAAYKEYAAQQDPQKMKILGEAFLKNFPFTPEYARFDEANRIDYNRVMLTVILLQIEKDDFKVVDRYVNQMSLATTINVYYKIIDITHSRKTMPDSFLYPYSELLVKHMQQLKQNRPFEYEAYSPDQWLTYFNDKYISGAYMPMIFTHISICRNVGKYEEGLKYAREAESFQHYKKESLNDDYVFLLTKTGHDDEVNDVLIKSMYENQASPAMLDLLKQDYVKKYHSEDGFNKYLQSLKNASASNTDQEAKTMLSKAMVDWTMTDIKGKKVSLKGLQGKTVVMDFWATWCVPCKASLPGMNLAVQHYKNDPSVVFYFVDTEETEADFKQQIKQYLKDNNYTFNVLFDNPMPIGKGTGEVFNRVSKAFQISGIPLKLIIDKNGVVRFMTSGYKGSASALADEISGMVELAKKQN